MNKLDLRKNIAVNGFQTISIGELLKMATDDVKREILVKFKINQTQLSQLYFDLGIKLETLNKVENSKNITYNEKFWNWFNLEFCRFAYMYFNDLPVEFERTKDIFIQSFEEFYIVQTINEDLTELIKKRFF